MRRLRTLEEGISSRNNLELRFCDDALSVSEISALSQLSASLIKIVRILNGNLPGLLPYPANDN